MEEMPKNQPMPTNHIPVNYVPAKTGDIFSLGEITIRIMEDGSRTDNRIGAAEFTLPPHSGGPPPHWHEMHDETFLVTQGRMSFHLPGKPDVVAEEGGYVVVPIRAPHTFSNPNDKEAKFFNTYTPAFYINYFKMLAEMMKGGEMTGEAMRKANVQAMANFATIPVPKK
ncbi:hypothetical protein B0A49_12315 [Cryomyces minteri]|uniref:Cupin type-2 domain-containing protein n=1 Tax=Cryomyces minteri TaxID=331657 RepID=A0A4U0V306_9PEZI|nr:hypothetical protein B0A49_12315 [Cryomyces minteri]